MWTHRTAGWPRYDGPHEPVPRLHGRLAVLRVERGRSRQDLADAVGMDDQLPIKAIFAREPFVPTSARLDPRNDERPGASAGQEG